MPELEIAPERVAWIILKLRGIEGKVAPAEFNRDEDEEGDDPIADALESRHDDPEIREVAGFIASLDLDEQIDLVSLMWVGRGTYDVDEWDAAREAAADGRTTSTARYLLGTPMASDYLADGLVAFGIDPENLESADSDEG